MKKFLIIAFIISICFNQDYIVDEYSFEWNVFKYGEVEISIKKDEDRAYMYLRDSGSWSIGRLQVNAIEAIEIGKELSNVNTIYKKLKNNPSLDVDEDVKLSSHTITYIKSEKSGFYISIRSNDAFSMSSFTLERKEALAIIPYLNDAENLISFINSQIIFE